MSYAMQPISITAQENQHVEILRLLAEAEKHLQAKDISKVFKTVDAILLLDPTNLEALAIRAEIYIEQQGADDTLAQKEIDSILKIDARHTRALLIQAELHIRSKDYTNALDTLNSISPNPRAFALRGRLYFEQREYSAALQELDSALTLDPCYLSALCLKAQVYLEQANYNQALIEAQRALEVSPEDPFSCLLEALALQKIHGYLESSYIQQRQHNNAFLSLLRSSSYDRRSQQSLEETQESLQASIDLINLLLAFSPDDGAAQLFKERKEDALRKALALAQVNQTLNEDPKNTEALLEKASLNMEGLSKDIQAFQKAPDPFYANKGQEQRVIEDTNAVLAKDPRNAKALMLQAQLDIRKKDDAGALRKLDLAAREHPSNAQIFILSATVYFKQNKQGEALRDLGIALDLDPNSVVAWTTKAEFHLEMGQLYLALEAVDKALEISAGNHQALLTKGLILQTQYQSAYNAYAKETGTPSFAIYLEKCYQAALQQQDSQKAQKIFDLFKRSSPLVQNRYFVDSSEKAFYAVLTSLYKRTLPNINKAQELLKKGDYQEALEHIQETLALGPPFQAWFAEELQRIYRKAVVIKAEIALQMGQETQIAADLEPICAHAKTYSRPFELDPLYARALLISAHLAISNADRDTLATLDYVTQSPYIPQEAALFVTLKPRFHATEGGRLFHKDLQKVLAVNPRDTLALRVIAWQDFVEQKYPEALEKIQKILSIAPQNNEAILLHGLILQKTSGSLPRDYIEAHARGNFPAYLLEYYANRTHWFTSPTQLDQEFLNLLLVFHPHHVEGYLAKGDYVSALRKIEELLFSENREAVPLLRTYCQKSPANREQGIATLTTYLTRNPTNTEARVLLAELYQANSQYRLALKEAETALQNNPEEPQKSHALRIEETLKNQFLEAQRLVKTAESYSKTNMYSFAIECLKKAAKKDPDNLSILSLLIKNTMQHFLNRAVSGAPNTNLLIDLKQACKDALNSKIDREQCSALTNIIEQIESLLNPPNKKDPPNLHALKTTLETFLSLGTC